MFVNEFKINTLLPSALLHLLLEGDFDEFRRTGDGHQHGDAHDAVQYVVAGHCVAQSHMNLVGRLRGGACQSAALPYAAQ